MVRSELKLNERVVEALKAPKVGESFTWDNEVRGFGVRTYYTGAKAFFYQYRPAGSKRIRRERIGAFPAMSVKTARKRAETLRAERQDSIVTDDNRTLDHIVPLFLESRATKLKARTVAEYSRLWNAKKGALSAEFGKVLVSDLSEDQVQRWHDSRASTPMLANRGVDLLAAICAWAEKRRYRPRYSNPCTRELIERYPERSRKKSLKVDEYRQLGAAIDRAATVGVPTAPALVGKARGMSKERLEKVGERPKRGPYKRTKERVLTPTNPVTLAVLRFLALSGWREQEALTLRWSAVDFTESVAVLEDTKTGKSARPLGSAALDILRAQTREEGNPFVFMGARAGTHLRETKTPWTNVKASAGLELRLHDLRHSFATTGRRLGYANEVIGALIGHKVSGMTAEYGEVPTEIVQQAAHRIASTIAQYLSAPDAKVLPFQPRHATAL